MRRSASFRANSAASLAFKASSDRLRAATNEVIVDKSFDTKLRATLSGKSYRSTPEQFAAQIRSEYEKYGALIKTLGIKVE